MGLESKSIENFSISLLSLGVVRLADHKGRCNLSQVGERRFLTYSDGPLKANVSRNRPTMMARSFVTVRAVETSHEENFIYLLAKDHELITIDNLKCRSLTGGSSQNRGSESCVLIRLGLMRVFGSRWRCVWLITCTSARQSVLVVRLSLLTFSVDICLQACFSPQHLIFILDIHSVSWFALLIY